MSGKALGAEEDIRGPEMLRREKRSMLGRTRAPAATPAPSCPRRLGGRIPGRADVTRGPAVPLARQVPSQRRAGLPWARVTPSRGPPGGSSATGPGWAPPGRRPGRDACARFAAQAAAVPSGAGVPARAPRVRPSASPAPSVRTRTLPGLRGRVPKAAPACVRTGFGAVPGNGVGVARFWRSPKRQGPTQRRRARGKRPAATDPAARWPARQGEVTSRSADRRRRRALGTRDGRQPAAPGLQWARRASSSGGRAPTARRCPPARLRPGSDVCRALGNRLPAPRLCPRGLEPVCVAEASRCAVARVHVDSGLESGE